MLGSMAGFRYVKKLFSGTRVPHLFRPWLHTRASCARFGCTLARGLVVVKKDYSR